MKQFILFIILIFSLVSCREVNTNNAEDAYKYWTKSNPNAKIHVINGQYWQSPHWSLEYRVYLELKADDTWWMHSKSKII